MTDEISIGLSRDQALVLFEWLARTGSGVQPAVFEDQAYEPIPYRDGGTSIIPRWPQDHAAIDPYRYPGY